MVSGWSFPHSMGIPKNLPSDGARGRSSPRLAAMKTALIFQALWKSHQVFHENCLKLGPQIDEFTRKVHWDDPIWPNSWMCSCSRYLINSLELGTSSGDCHCKYIVPTFIWVSIMNCLKNHSPQKKMPCGIRYPSFTFIGPDHFPLYLHNIIIHYPWYFYIYLQNLIDDYTTWFWSLRFSLPLVWWTVVYQRWSLLGFYEWFTGV